MTENEKRYLVYKNWNGQIHVSLEYGDHATGEGVAKRTDELTRFEVKHKINDLNILKELYPMEK